MTDAPVPTREEILALRNRLQNWRPGFGDARWKIMQDAVALLDRALAQATEPAGEMPSREAVARIADPYIWGLFDQCETEEQRAAVRTHPHFVKALGTADAIAALYAPFIAAKAAPVSTTEAKPVAWFYGLPQTAERVSIARHPLHPDAQKLGWTETPLYTSDAFAPVIAKLTADAAEARAEGERANKLWWMLAVIDAMRGGVTDVSDYDWHWLTLFCNDGEEDTFNRAIDAGYLTSTYDGDYDVGRAAITPAGRDLVRSRALPVPDPSPTRADPSGSADEKVEAERQAIADILVEHFDYGPGDHGFIPLARHEALGLANEILARSEAKEAGRT